MFHLSIISIVFQRLHCRTRLFEFLRVPCLKNTQKLFAVQWIGNRQMDYTDSARYIQNVELWNDASREIYNSDKEQDTRFHLCAKS